MVGVEELLGELLGELWRELGKMGELLYALGS